MLVFATIAAVGTAGYSVVDDRALRIARIAATPGVAAWHVTAVYAFFECVTSVFWLGCYLLIRPTRRNTVRALLQNRSDGISSRGTNDSALMGVGIYLTYTLVLVSLAFVNDVSYVVAFRQLSIPIGVVAAAAILRERLTAPRLFGTLLMFAGVVLVGIG